MNDSARWDYRVLVRLVPGCPTPQFELHPVYYAADGSILRWTQIAAEPATSPAELRRDLEQRLAAFGRPALLRVVIDGRYQLQTYYADAPVSTPG